MSAQEKFYVAESKNSDAFFTTASSYDFPVFVSLDEATCYESFAAADAVRIRLIKNGSYGARVHKVSESVEQAVLPKFKRSATVEADDQKSSVIYDDQNTRQTVVQDDETGDVSRVPSAAVRASEEEEQACDEECSEEDEELYGRRHHGERVWRGETADRFWIKLPNGKKFGPYETSKQASSELLNRPDLRKFKAEVVSESASAPESVDRLEYDLPALDADEASKIGQYETSDKDGEKMAANPEIVALLNDALKKIDIEFQETGHNTEAGTQLKTATAAFTQLRDLIMSGSLEDFKKAQILYQSLMSPLSYRLPQEVVAFLGRGGKKSLLRDKFDVKLKEHRGWSDYVVNESRNKLDVPTPSVEEIAKKHKCTVECIEAALKKGIEVEKEHTTDEDVACEIARDHLAEDPEYYEKLAKVEKK